MSQALPYLRNHRQQNINNWQEKRQNIDNMEQQKFVANQQKKSNQQFDNVINRLERPSLSNRLFSPNDEFVPKYDNIHNKSGTFDKKINYGETIKANPKYFIHIMHLLPICIIIYESYKYNKEKTTPTLNITQYPLISYYFMTFMLLLFVDPSDYMSSRINGFVLSSSITIFIFLQIPLWIACIVIRHLRIKLTLNNSN
jgi:hypothetical protein